MHISNDLSLEIQSNVRYQISDATLIQTTAAKAATQSNNTLIIYCYLICENIIYSFLIYVFTKIAFL